MADEAKKNESNRSLAQINEFVRGLTASQRAMIVGGAALVGATLWIFVVLLGKPSFTTLYSGLKPAEAQSLASRLAAKGIKYELSPDGSSVLVPADKLDQSRLETAAQGLPRSARLGFEIFDTPNWMGSDFSEKVNYQRALEGELERTLATLSEVEAVRVHVVLPPDSVFSEQERAAKAAVIIKTRGGGLSQQAQAAIPQLVASAVDKLRPENVTLVDADSNAPLSHARGPGGAPGSEVEQQLQAALLRTFEPVLGPEHVRASVRVEYDISSSEDTEETYDPKSAVAISEQQSEEQIGGGAPVAGGVPGTASNVPNAQDGKPPVVVATAGERQSSRSESSTFAVNKLVRHRVQPPGRLKRIAAAVLVDDATESETKEAGASVSVHRKRTPDEMKDYEKLAQAAIGFDSARGDILAVQNLSFAEVIKETPPPPPVLDRVRTVTQQWSWVFRLLGIAALFAVVYFLLLNPVKRQIVTAFRELPARMKPERLPFKEAAAAKVAAVESVAEMAELPAGSEDAKRMAALKRNLIDKVKKEPSNASKLVQSWIREVKP